MTMHTPGTRFRAALKAEKPLHLLGINDPYLALMLAENGFKAGYLSGAGLSNFEYGVPDVGLVELPQVASKVAEIAAISDLPLLVDVDTGWDDPEVTVQTLIAAGAAALHIEDQTEDKRCGHLDGKSIVETEQMCVRIRAAAKGRTSGLAKDENFVILARTDAFAVEGLNGTIARMVSYLEAGADGIFAEAMTDLEHYDKIRAAIGPHVPLLANMTEFGKTDLYTTAQLASHGVDMVLSPVSLTRAMHTAAGRWMKQIRTNGSTAFMVEAGDIEHRQTYADRLDYNPKVDNRDTMRAKLNKRRHAQ